MSIPNIANLRTADFLESFTPNNITSGFSKPGIWPFNQLLFGDYDFASIEIFEKSSQPLNLSSEFQNAHEEIREDQERQEVDFMGPSQKETIEKRGRDGSRAYEANSLS